MEYVYASLLLHKAGKEISEENLSKVLEAAGVDVDPARIKAVVAALSEIDIDEAIKSAAFPVAAAPTPVPTEEAPKEEKKEEEEEKKEEEAVEGLSALFG
ncbi:MAG: 50S ribosomal protein P1 [Candidatus Asgardarchaeia archaeon]